MRRRLIVAVVVLATGAALLPGAAPASAATSDPSTWTSRRLAAQLTMSCVQATDGAAMRRQARMGIGGMTLLGRPSTSLPRTLASMRAAAVGGTVPVVASDEEGGAVQRLRPVIYRLPSASTMGTWAPATVRGTAQQYGTRMRGLGVTLDLGPVADLSVAGSYLTNAGRTFSSSPTTVATQAGAWREGLATARVGAVLKHWPGHGHASNTHTGASTVPPLTALQRADLVPFDLELARGAAAVMVAHVTSPGLTEAGVPASQSPHALQYLRRKAGPNVVIITDSLSMAAASSARGVSPERAAIRALRAGADWALTCVADPGPTVTAIAGAIDRGSLPRARAVASARRILAFKAGMRVSP